MKGKVHFKISIDNYPTAFEALCGIEDYFSLKAYTENRKKVTCKSCIKNSNKKAAK